MPYTICWVVQYRPPKIISPSIRILQDICEAGAGVHMHRVNDWCPAMDVHGCGGSVSSFDHLNIDAMIADCRGKLLHISSSVPIGN